MKQLFLSLILALATTSLFAQAQITFDKDTHDFGEIQEQDGSVSVDFTYTNTGSTPLVLHNVQASCGCTTPEWTKEPTLPGATGVIKVSFNPSNRPGAFNKTITVQSNAATTSKVLRITGTVLQKPKTQEDLFPVKMDSLRLADSHVAFTKITPEETKTSEVQVWNPSSQELTPQFINVPAHVTIACIPATIKPGETGVIQALYDASKKNDWGFVTDQVYVVFDDTKKYSNRLTISATIAEDFSNLTEEELARAPQIDFDNKNFEFGTVAQGQKVEHDYIVTNNGEENLIIRKVKASCGCTAVSPAKTLLAKGESTEIHATFDSRGKSGRQQKTITVISNDPKQSNVLLRISGTVTVPGQELKQ